MSRWPVSRGLLRRQAPLVALRSTALVIPKMNVFFSLRSQKLFVLLAGRKASCWRFPRSDASRGAPTVPSLKEGRAAVLGTSLPASSVRASVTTGIDARRTACDARRSSFCLALAASSSLWVVRHEPHPPISAGLRVLKPSTSFSLRCSYCYVVVEYVNLLIFGMYFPERELVLLRSKMHCR